jgi:hypothetical protein
MQGHQAQVRTPDRRRLAPTNGDLLLLLRLLLLLLLCATAVVVIAALSAWAARSQ